MELISIMSGKLLALVQELFQKVLASLKNGVASFDVQKAQNMLVEASICIPRCSGGQHHEGGAGCRIG